MLSCLIWELCGTDALITDLFLVCLVVDVQPSQLAHFLINIDSQWKKLVALEIIKQGLHFPRWKSLFMRETEDRILNVLSICSFSPIFFLKGEITQDYFGSVSIYPTQPFFGYFSFTVYRLSCLKKIIISLAIVSASLSYRFNAN